MHLTSLDLVVIVAYLAGVTLFGVAFRRGQSTVRDYFLGGRTAPWWALALSIVATETSTLTIVGTPALAFAGNLTFLQFVFGYFAGRVMVVLLFLPHYFRGEYYTAYQLMERRFGPKVKAVAASTFLVTRVLAEGVRVAAIALVVSVALGTAQRTSILLIMALVLIYTFEGGMKAVIWTDVVQFILYFSGSLAAFFLLLHRIPGGWETIVHAAAPAHKFRILDFSFSLTNPAKLYTFWSGMIGGTFFTMASHGTDQTIVQRLLAAKSERESKIALLASGAIILVQFALFLVLGVMLYAWQGAPALIAGRSYDTVFPDFIVTAMPPGARGAIIAAILAVAMSNSNQFLRIRGIVLVFELREEPGAGVSPMALGGCQRDLAHPGDLGQGQAGEEAELDQLGLRRVFRCQLVERLVDRFEVFGWVLLQETRGIQVDSQATAAAFETFLASRVLDQDPAHRLRGRREEVGAAIPLLLVTFADKPEIGLVHQIGRQEGLPRGLASEPLAGQPAQFVVDQG